MKLVYKLSPLEQCIVAVQTAHDAGRTIARLEVTAAEMEALLDCPIGPNKDDPTGSISCFKDHELFICGVPVVVNTTAPRTAQCAAALGADVPVLGQGLPRLGSGQADGH